MFGPIGAIVEPKQTPDSKEIYRQLAARPQGGSLERFLRFAQCWCRLLFSCCFLLL